MSGLAKEIMVRSSGMVEKGILQDAIGGMNDSTLS